MPNPIQQWEYLVYTDGAIDKQYWLRGTLETHGKEGWELVQIIDKLLIFKRPKHD